MEVLRAGVIGLGIGKAHVRGYRKAEDIDLVAVADLRGDLLESFTGPATRGYTSAEEMLEREKLDIVSVCTPPSSHADLALKAFDAGTNVLCEKPMAPTLGDCDRMLRGSERAGLKLMIGFKKRFVPSYNALRESFSGDLGEPYMMDFSYVCTGGVRKDWFWDESDAGGPITENTVHAVDILRYLVGDVERVYAEGDSFLAASRGIKQIDSAVFTLRFRTGAIATVCAGAWARGPLKNERFLCYSRNGIAQVSGEFDKPSQLDIFTSADGRNLHQEFPDRDPIGMEVSHFAQCVRTGGRPRATGEDGRKALAVCLAVKGSARSGSPVSLET
jgi:predicted dehydrogenase